MTTMMATAQVLAFLGSAATILCLLFGAVLLAMLGRRYRAERVLIAAMACAVIYTGLLFAAGWVSPARILAVGQGKAFCEIDCHVVYSVTDARAERDTLLLTVRELFDPASTSPRRGNAALTPGGRRFALVDRDGKRWRPAGVRMLDSAPLFAALRPGEAHRAQLRFTVPRGTIIAGLLVEDDSPLSPLLIGHERSPFHKKTLLAVPEVRHARAAREPFAPARPG